ncbi:MAG: phosphatidate cytidylyltransferase, partial [Planctomycetota bacterium]|nr:phosphatidate cytidylyltransferase [Planctomycetota bacterium]
YSIFVIVYIGSLMAFLASLRFYHSNAVGMTALLSLLVVVKSSDAGAYFIGRMLGRHKLAPRMSPGKSVEGAVGAMLTGVLTSWLFFKGIAPLTAGDQVSAPLLQVILFGIVIASTGMIGDLFESVIKRDFNAKDSSKWLPGLGGILDIFDSILAAAPAAYVFWVLGCFLAEGS